MSNFLFFNQSAAKHLVQTDPGNALVTISFQKVEKFATKHLMTFEKKSRIDQGEKNLSRLPTGQQPNC